MTKTIAEMKYPDGMPGLLSMKEFGQLIGVSRPTALKIVKEYPDYTVRRGNTQMVGVGLYQRLTHDENVKISNRNALI